MIEVQISVPTGEDPNGEPVFDTLVVTGRDIHDLIRNILAKIALDIIENCESDDAEDYAEILSKSDFTIVCTTPDDELGESLNCEERRLKELYHEYEPQLKTISETSGGDS